MPVHTPAPVRQVAAALILAVEIAIHVALSPAHLDEVPYVGVLFVVASVLLTAALAAILIAPGNPLGWYLGSALCAGMAAAFVISRATGLPDYHEAWSSDGGLGLISLPPELLFLIVAVGPLRSIRSPRSDPEPAPRRTRTRSTGLVHLIDRDALAVEMAQPVGPPTTSSSQPCSLPSPCTTPPSHCTTLPAALENRCTARNRWCPRQGAKQMGTRPRQGAG